MRNAASRRHAIDGELIRILGLPFEELKILVRILLREVAIECIFCSRVDKR